MTEGRVYLVGAGPGDPGLLTVRGRELLAQADVVVYDHLAAPCLLDHARPDAERIYVGKRAAAHTLGQQDINQLLIDRARGGAEVVRLKGGDPFVFGRGGEEALALVEAGIAFEAVPGVTAGVAAPAYAGIPVTHRHMASSLGLVTGHEAPEKDGSSLHWQALADWSGTLVFYMGVSNLESICRRLVAAGLDPYTPVAVIRWGTTTRQQVETGTLDTMPDVARAAGLKPPAVIVVGQVVALREKLGWFERRPLFGRRIVVTRARAQASALAAGLERLGAEVIELPTIRIAPPDDPAPLERAVRELASFDWIVFTSVNGVDAFCAALHGAGLDARALAPNRLCAIGPATAERLGRFGLRPDACPAKYTSAQIVETLVEAEDLAGKRILCPRADIAPPDLPEALSARGAVVRSVTAYRTVPEDSDANRWAEIISDGPVDWITFTSSSTVKNFFSTVPPEGLRARPARIASIGPVTSATVEEFGFAPEVEADDHTIPGLIEAILAREGPMQGET